MLALTWSSVMVILALCYGKNPNRTISSLKKSLISAKALLPGLLAMIAFVGLLLAAFPEEQLIRLFALRSLWGFILVSLVGALVTIPGPIAFPLAGALLERGASPAILASFITTLTMVGLATAGIEISYFGARFTLLRQGLSFFAAIAIGLIMGGLL